MCELKYLKRTHSVLLAADGSGPCRKLFILKEKERKGRKKNKEVVRAGFVVVMLSYVVNLKTRAVCDSVY